MEFKTFPANVKDIDAKQGIVTGYYSSWGQDEGSDIIESGAFAKTLQERGPDSARPRIKHLWQHDWWTPIGVPQVLKEDDFGLYFETKIAQTMAGRDAIVLYEEGVITEHSIGYDPVKVSFNGDIRKLEEIRLWEGSSVTWGMNEHTPMVGMKSAEPKALMEQQIARIERVLRRRSLSSEELAEALEMQLKEWRALLINFDALKPAAEPPKDTRPPDEPQSAGKALDFTGLLAGIERLKEVN